MVRYAETINLLEQLKEPFMMPASDYDSICKDLEKLCRKKTFSSAICDHFQELLNSIDKMGLNSKKTRKKIEKSKKKQKEFKHESELLNQQIDTLIMQLRNDQHSSDSDDSELSLVGFIRKFVNTARQTFAEVNRI